ncbi:MAG: DUF11 domain-containing protein [Acidobacteria bacterium]|nr:DUF11 domain-containing protein [Acidobacteriota bacterium]
MGRACSVLVFAGTALLVVSAVPFLAITADEVSPSPAMAIAPAETAAQHRAALAGVTTPEARRRVAEAIAAVPLHFERNDGQAERSFGFVANGAGYRVGLAPTGASVTVSTPRSAKATSGAVSTTFAFALRGSDPHAAVATDAPLPGVVNYLKGNDPARWQQGVPTFARVRYADVYDGIDVVYYGNQRRLQYDFIVAPGADPSRVAFEVRGAERLSIGPEGQLEMTADGRTIEQQRPYTYQVAATGERTEVPSRFVLDGDVVRFAVGGYDPARELVIDPVLTYSTWFGRLSQEVITDIALDAGGNIIITGHSAAGDTFPATPGAIKSVRGGAAMPGDAFVAKFTPSGAALVFSTLFGGDGEENLAGNIAVGGVAADAAGNVTLVGSTRSANFPTTADADDGTFNETVAPIDSDAFMTTLSPSGTLIYSTYLGGSDLDFATSVAIDAAGHIFVAGVTYSSTAEGFPSTATTFDGVIGGLNDAFLVRYGATGTRQYVSYLGGTGAEYFNPSVDVLVDATNVVFVSGETSSTSFPTLNAAQNSQGGGGTSGDAFLVRIDTSVNGAGGLLYGTFWGGNRDETFTGIARGGAGVVYATGFTRSINIATTVLPGGATPVDFAFDAIVVKFDTNLAGAASLAWALRLGGSQSDTASDIGVDAAGRTWITGYSNSTDLPLKSAFDTAMLGTGRPFVAQINAAGTDTVFLSLAGGRNTNATTLSSVTVNAAGEVYMAGWAAQPAINSDSLELVSPFQSVYGGGPVGTNDGGSSDGVIQKLGPSADLSLAKASAPAAPATVLPGATLTYTLTLANQGPDAALGITVTDTLPAAVSLNTCSATSGGVCGGTGNAQTVTFASLASGASATITFVTTVTGAALPGTTITNTASVNASSGDAVPANNSATTSIAVPTLSDPTGDADTDGLPNGWEQQYGLNPLSNTADNGASGDPDTDGKTNAQEFNEGTHPRGFVITFLAEGATGAFFDTRLAIANPTPSPALVLTRFQKTDGTTIRDYRTVPGRSRATIDVETVAGLQAAEFSTLVEADIQVVVDRTLTWDGRGYGSHAERGILTRTATEWYFAEGATHSGFNLFYLIQNPNEQAATVEVRYLRPPPAAVLTRTYTVGAQSRFNIWVNSEAATDPALASLAASDVSVVMRSTNAVPIIAERALYRDLAGQVFGIGHESAGVTAPATTWFLAEGATGTFLDMFVLLANPNNTPAQVTVEYLLTTGTTLTKSYVVDPNSRQNIWVDLEELPLGSGLYPLADVATSATVTSTNGVPIIVERSMYWPGPSFTDWREAHNSPGSTVTGTRWAVAEGEVGGPRSTETYVLVANTSALAGQVTATLLFEDGTAPAEKTFSIAARSRFNIQPAEISALAVGRRFGMIVESVGASPVQIVVERAMYSNADGVVWAAGTNALATRLQ